MEVVGGGISLILIALDGLNARCTGRPAEFWNRDIIGDRSHPLLILKILAHFPCGKFYTCDYIAD